MHILDRFRELARALRDELHWRVLEFTRSLAHPKLEGVPGRQLLRFAGTIPIGDTKVIGEAVEEGCEQVDHND
jgi:hypothetical protein